MYEVKADDVVVLKSLSKRPKQWQVDMAAQSATRRGWNGVTLDLYSNGKLVDRLMPSAEVREAQ